MKIKSQLRFMATLLLVISLLTTCKDEEHLQSTEGQLQLRLQTKDLVSSSGRTAIDLTPTAIIMTLVGNGAETRKTLDLISFSGEYATNPISLSIGNYQITEFIVTNSDDEVIYVVPKKDSEFGNLVSQPLPISITISSEQVQTVAPQVISVAGKSASQFGYIAFGIDVLPSFKITTMGMVDGVAEMITPRLVLTQASDTLLDYILEDAVNEVPFVDNDVDLRLTLMEHGFARYSQVFSADSLLNYAEEPMFIMLEKAFTFEMGQSTSMGGGILEFLIGCNSQSNLIVDWGTNVDIDTLDCSPNNILKLEASGLNEPSYFISITGEIGNIIDFKTRNCPILSIHLANLIGLENLSLVNSSVPNLDLSKNQNLLDFHLKNQNANLLTLDFSNLKNLRQIKIREKSLNKIYLNGCDSIKNIDLAQCKGLIYPYIGDNEYEYEMFPLSSSNYLNLDSCNINQVNEMRFLWRLASVVEGYEWYYNIKIRDVKVSLLGNALPNGDALQTKKELEDNLGWTILFDE